MMSSRLPDVIDEHMLCCPLCAHEAQHPKVLPCLHVFCQRCLEDHVKRWEQQQEAVQSRQRPISEEYLTFPDTPKLTAKFEDLWNTKIENQDGHHQNQDGLHQKEVHRDSGYEDGDARKKLQRNRDRGVLTHQAEYYRLRYKRHVSQQSHSQNGYHGRDGSSSYHGDTVGYHGNDSSSTEEGRNHSNHTPSPSLSITGSHGGDSPVFYNESKAETRSGRYSYDNNQQTDRKINSTEQKLTKTISSPLMRFGVSDDKQVCNQHGHVSTMVHMFERKTSVSEEAPPMAKFRTKAKSQTSSISLVPLHERPVPVYSHHMIRSKSHDTSIKFSDMSLMPRSISVSPQGNNDSGLGSADTEKSFVFLEEQKPKTPVKREPSLTEDFYEGYEIPEDLLRHRSSHECRAEIFSRMAESGVYETLSRLPQAEDKHNKPATNVQKRSRLKLTIETRSPLSSPDSPNNNIYDEIPVLREFNINTLPTSPSRGRLLSRGSHKSKDDHDVPQKHRSIRRNSSILDSYVTASALASNDQSLNVDIPLCRDDSNRLSELYLQMGATPAQRRSRLSERYINMDGLEKPNSLDDASLGLGMVESVATLIGAISAEFGGTPTLSEIKIEDELPSNVPAEEEPDSPAIYMNTSPAKPQTVGTDDLDLDTAIPIYDTPPSPQKNIKVSETPQHDMQSKTTKSTPPSVKLTVVPKPPPDVPEDIEVLHVPCPTCGREFLLTDHQVSALHDCEFVSQLQEVVSSQKCEKKSCQNCDTRAADYKCIDCFIDLCPGCQNGHNWSKTNRSHKIVTLQQLQSGKYQKEIMHVQKTICQRDKTQEASFMCIQCGLMQCSDCVGLYCRNHRTQKLEEVADRDRDLIQSKLQDLQHRQESLHGAVDNLKTYQHHCTTERAELLDQINSHHDFIKLLLDRSFDLLKVKVTQSLEAETQEVGRVMADVQGTVDASAHVMTFVDQLLDHGNYGNVVAMTPLLKDEFLRLLSRSPPEMASQLELRYTPCDVGFKAVEGLCGQVDQVTRPLGGARCRTRRSELTVHHTVYLELLHEFTTRIASDEKGCRPNGLVRLPNGHLVVVDNINKKLKVFNTEGRLLHEISPHGDHTLVDPWDVTMLQNGVLAVTDKGAKEVKLFKQDGTFVTSFGGHLKQPWGICTNSRGEILVTDTELGRVFVHNSTGKLLHTIPNQTLGKAHKLKCPEYICSNSMDDIIVSDFENHCILGFDWLGRPLFKFGKKGTGHDEFYYPLGVTTDTLGNIYAVNYKNQRITVTKRNGQFLCCLMTQQPLHSLQALAIDPRGHLVAIDGGMIKIFKLPPSIMCNADDNDQNLDRADVLILKNTDNNSTDPTNKETSV